MSKEEYELAFTEGEAYALNSLVTEWEDYKDNYGNTVQAIPHQEVLRLSKRLTSKYKMLKRSLTKEVSNPTTSTLTQQH